MRICLVYNENLYLVPYTEENMKLLDQHSQEYGTTPEEPAPEKWSDAYKAYFVKHWPATYKLWKLIHESEPVSTVDGPIKTVMILRLEW